MGLVVTVILLLIPRISFGSEALTIRELIDVVNQKFPPLEIAKKEEQIAEADLRSSEGAFDIQWKTRFQYTPLSFYQNQRFDTLLEQPTTLWGATLFGGYRLGTGKFAIYDGKLETNPGGELRLGFNLPLLRDGPIDRRRANLQKSKWGVDVAKLQVSQQQLETLRNATHRYWDWVVSGQRVFVFRKLLKIAEERDAALAERVKQGDLPDFERRDNERAILQRRSLLISAERTFQQMAIELSLFFRGPAGEPILVGEERIPLELAEPQRTEVPEANFEKAMSRRPELARLLAAKAQNEIERDVAANSQMPKIDLQLQTVRSVRDGSITRDGTQLEAGVLVEIPLQANVAGGREDAAIITRSRLEVQERFLKDRIIADVRDAMSAVEASFLRYSVTQKEVELAKKMEQGERVRFFQGESNLLFVNLREQTTADAQIRELEAIGDYRKSIASLKAAIAEF